MDFVKIKPRIFFLLLFFPLFSIAQTLHQDKNFTLSNTVTGDHVYEARDYITLDQPNFHYVATGSDEFVGKIDPSIVVETDIVTVDPYYHPTIDKNLSVGYTPGSISVSPTGAAVYNIPIQLPSGTNGFVPDLSINYNSQSGNGIAGLGWHIAGISSINRIGSNLIHDNDLKTIKLTNSDNFSYNGSRLFTINGSNGANGTTYGTEIESYSLITSHGAQGNGPSWFEVVTKNGLRIEFGNTPDSKYLIGSTVLFWRINKIEDRNGNYIQYKYKQHNSQVVIEEISYTGNSNVSVLPYNKIKFYYSERPDKNEIWIGETGYSIKNSLLLRQIAITADDLSFKKYNFKYSSNLYTQLIEVIEESSSGQKLNGTYFKYGPAQSTFVTSSSTLLQGKGNGGVISGDYNGDGYTDILYVTFDNFHEKHTGYELYLNEADNGSANIFEPTPTTSGTFSLKAHIEGSFDLINQTPTKFLSYDFNGDGMEDFVVVYTADMGGGIEKITDLRIFSYNKTNESFFSTSYFDPTTSLDPIPHDYFFNTGDYDGDGAMDFIIIYEEAGIAIAEIIFPRINKTNSLPSQVTSELYSAEKIIPIEFNGDGKTDIMILGNNSSIIYTFERNSAQQIVANNLYNNATTPNYSHQFFPGDFNGDGKTDLLSHDSLNNQWELRYSTGTTFFNSAFPYVLPNLSTISPKEKFKVGDYNGDGKTDAIYLSLSGVDTYISNGMDFEHLSNNHFGITLENNLLISGDYNGDGRLDEMNRPLTNSSFDIFHFDISNPTSFNQEFLLWEVVGGSGHISRFRYKSLTTPGIMEENEVSTYPLIFIQPPLAVVSNTQTSKGKEITSGYYTQYYEYSDAMFHLRGKGFLGFKKMQVHDVTTNTIKLLEYELNANYYIPYLKKEELIENFSAINSAISDKILTYTFTNISNNRFKQELSTVESNNYVNNFHFYTTYFYDSYGNVIHENSVNDEENTEIFRTFVQKSSWIPSNIKTQDIHKKRGTQPYFITSEVFNYYLDGNIKDVTISSGGESVTSEYNYDFFGNLISTSKTSAGLSPKETSLVFDDKGRFPIKFLNELDQITEFRHDRRWGNPTWIKDINENITKLKYNDFGRKIEAIDPLGNTTHYNLSWYSGSEPEIIYYTSASGINQPDKKVYLDILGREVKVDIEGFNGDIVTIEKTYNLKGLLESKTAPHFETSSDPYIETEYYYDDFNRIGTIKNSIGPKESIINFGYSLSNGKPITNIISNAGDNISKTMDVSGKIVSASDYYGGTLDYEYYSSGKLKKVSLDAQEISSMEYDPLGYQTKLSDKNAGDMLYDYNTFGKLESQTDALNQTFSMTYNELGQIKTKQSSAGTTTFSYIENGNGLNQLKSIKGPNGVEYSYNYDSYGKIDHQTNKIDGHFFNISYDYDKFGRLEYLTYPSGLKLKYIYNSQGYLTQIKDDANQSIIWQLNSMNALGQITSYNQGSIVTYKEYDDFGFPSRIYTPSIQDLRFNFDHKTGNLIDRTNYLTNRKESFEYDNLNRLETIELENTITNAIISTYETSYSANGNILEKDGIGNYEYNHPSKSNAVTEIKNPSSTISTLTQNITYTDFHSTETISEGDYDLTITYGPNQQRVKTELREFGQLKQTKYFLPGYEKIVEPLSGGGKKITEISYINVGNDLVAMYIQINGAATMYYTSTDYLGSILKVFDNSGNIVAEQSFDAWGRYRNPSDWTYTNIPSVPDWLYRGYTGHEHLFEFQLVNMNGRMYDPIISRMLSPDNFVQDATSTQSYNRYSYVLNNPMKYTDPSGEFGFFAILVGALILSGSAAHASGNPSKNFWKYFTPVVATALGAALVSAAAPIWLQMIHGAAASSFAYAGSAALSGQAFSPADFGRSALIGGIGAGIGAGLSKGIGNLANGKGFFGSKNPLLACSDCNGFLLPEVTIIEYQKIAKAIRISTAVGTGMWNIANVGDYTIYFKPDNTININGKTYTNSKSYALAPGETWHYRIDGIGIPKGRPGEVFKINDLFDSAFGVKVYNNTAVIGESLHPMLNDINQLWDGGWKNQEWLLELNRTGDTTWNSLFQRVGINP